VAHSSTSNRVNLTEGFQLHLEDSQRHLNTRSQQKFFKSLRKNKNCTLITLPNNSKEIFYSAGKQGVIVALITPGFEYEDFYISERPDSNPIQRPSWRLSPKHHHRHNFQVVMVHSSITSNRRNPTQGFQIQLEGYSRSPQQVIPIDGFHTIPFEKNNISLRVVASENWSNLCFSSFEKFFQLEAATSPPPSSIPSTETKKTADSWSSKLLRDFQLPPKPAAAPHNAHAIGLSPWMTAQAHTRLWNSSAMK
jgi:hypothetical protein